MTADQTVVNSLCPDCGHSMCTCGFDCECGCTWAAHDSGEACDDCPCCEFTEENPAPWACPKVGCDLGVDGHDLALVIEHTYGGVPTKSGRNFDAEESRETAGRILGDLT